MSKTVDDVLKKEIDRKNIKSLSKDIFIINVTDITSTRNPKNKRYLVETNLDNYKFDEDTVVKFMLFKDHEFTKEEFDKVLYSAKVNEGMNKALNYLSRGKKSTYEVKDYLRNKKDYSEEIIDDIAKKLKEFKYLDDYDYAISVVNTYGETKGPNYLRKKLEDKCIHKNIIDEVLASYNNEENKAMNIALKLMATNDFSKYPINKQKNKIYSKLITNGFSMTISTKIINKLEFVDDSDENLKKDLAKCIKKYSDNSDANIFKDNEIKNKIISSLMSKGYNYKNIKRTIEEFNNNNE